MYHPYHFEMYQLYHFQMYHMPQFNQCHLKACQEGCFELTKVPLWRRKPIHKDMTNRKAAMT